MGSQRGFSKVALELLLPLDPVLVSGELLGEGLGGLCGDGWRGRAGRGTLRVVLCPGTGVIWGLVVPGLGGSWESLWPQAIKSALLLIQGRLSGLIAVKNSSNGRENSARTICRSARPRRKEGCSLLVPQTLFLLSKPHPQRG